MTPSLSSITVHHLFISPGHDFRGRHGQGRLDHGVMPCDSIDCIAGKGIKGDRYFDYKDDYKGQITFFDFSVFELIKTKFDQPNLCSSVFRRNVILEGIDLNQLIGKVFEIQGIQFSGSEECAPCYWMDEAVGVGAESFLKGRGGLRCRILTSGILQPRLCNRMRCDALQLGKVLKSGRPDVLTS